jgi:hypothetical protein
MSDQQFGPYQNPNGPHREKTPHSGDVPVDRGGERPVFDFGKMTIEEAIAAGYLQPTVPNNLGEYADPTQSQPTEAYEPLQPPKRRGFRRGIAAVVGIAVLGGAAALGPRILGGDNEQNPQPQPGVAVGNTPTPNAPESRPTQAPTNTEDTPYDPEASISQKTGAEARNKLEARKPFYNNPITSDTFARLAPSDAVRKEYSQFEIGYRPQKNLFPTIDAVDKHLSGESDPANLLKSQQEIQQLFTDGSLEKAIATSNKLFGTNYTMDDFILEPNEIPKSRTDANKPQVAKFLATDVVGMTQKWQTLVYALKFQESQNTNGGDVGDALTSYKLDETIHITPQSRTAAHQNTDTLSLAPGAGILASDFKPDSTNQSTALLINAVGAGRGADSNGFIFEQSDDGKNVIAPVLTVIADTRTNMAQESGGRLDFGYTKAKVASNVLMMPVTYKGKSGVTAISLENHTVAFG